MGASIDIKDLFKGMQVEMLASLSSYLKDIQQIKRLLLIAMGM